MPYPATLAETIDALMGGPKIHGSPTFWAFVFCLIPVLMCFLLDEILPNLERDLAWCFRKQILDEEML